MFKWFDPAMARRVDELTRDHCEPKRGLGELKQLGNLFNEVYLLSLYQEMAAGIIRNTRYGAVLQIKLAWIDKIPLAKTSAKPIKTELGDAVLFAIEERRIVGQTVPIARSAKAVILQAKITERYQQIKKPTVPIAPMTGSTKDEYDLLSAWPPFDLYKTSGSGAARATGIVLNATGTKPQPFGWYMAAPKAKHIPSNVDTTWPSWWMLGPPVQGHDCVFSFGSFLRYFLNGMPIPTKSGPLTAGASFSCPSYPPDTASASGWDRVCAEIINIVEDPDMHAPQSVFGVNTSRMASVDEIYLDFIYPIELYNTFLSPYLINKYRLWSFNPSQPFDWYAHRPGKK